MGRFDALTKLDDRQQDVKPPTVEPSTPLPIKSEQSGEIQTNEVKKPANPQAGKTARPLARKTANPQLELVTFEKPEKYTTRLVPSLIKKVRVHAVDKDMKDYEVLSTALKQYFERNK